MRKLRSGDLDMAVVWRIPDAPSRDDGFDELHLADDPYWVVLPVGHPLARRKDVALNELKDERFSAPPAAAEHALPYRALLDRLWAEAGIDPRVHEVQDVTVARAMIAAGLCVGLLSELTMSVERPEIAVRPVRGSNPCRRLYATWLRGRRVPAVARMVRYLAEAAEARLSAA